MFGKKFYLDCSKISIVWVDFKFKPLNQYDRSECSLIYNFIIFGQIQVKYEVYKFNMVGNALFFCSNACPDRQSL